MYNLRAARPLLKDTGPPSFCSLNGQQQRQHKRSFRFAPCPAPSPPAHLKRPVLMVKMFFKHGNHPVIIFFFSVRITKPYRAAGRIAHQPFDVINLPVPDAGNCVPAFAPVTVGDALRPDGLFSQLIVNTGALFISIMASGGCKTTVPPSFCSVIPSPLAGRAALVRHAGTYVWKKNRPLLYW